MPVRDLTQAVGILARVGTGLTVVHLIVTSVLATKLRRLRADQIPVMERRLRRRWRGLSPDEHEAIKLALAGEMQPLTLGT